MTLATIELTWHGLVVKKSSFAIEHDVVQPPPLAPLLNSFIYYLLLFMNMLNIGTLKQKHKTWSEVIATIKYVP